MPRLLTHPCCCGPSKPEMLVASVADDPLIPLITTVPASGSQDDVHAYLQRQHEQLPTGAGYSFATADSDSDSDEAIGQIGLWTSRIDTGHASTGYWIAPQHRRRGYARAALQALTMWACGLEDAFGAGLGSGDVEGRRRRVDSGDVEALTGQTDRETTSSTPDVHDGPRPKLAGDGEVVVEVLAVAVDLVIQRREAKIGEQGVRHAGSRRLRT